MSETFSKISFIGAGNVASNLALALFRQGLQIEHVWSRDDANSKSLAERVKANVCSELNQLPVSSDLYIISVKDDVLEDVLTSLPENIPALVHTSGSIDMRQLNNYAKDVGVVYPVYSFKKSMELEWQQVPFCVEGNRDAFTDQLFALCRLLSNKVQYLNSDQRKHLHIAAIMANNFTNYLFSLSYDLSVKHNIPFDTLLPLILQTTERLSNEDPFELQTGPAIRGDLKVIQEHLTLLDSDDQKEVYDFLSQKIIKKGR